MTLDGGAVVPGDDLRRKFRIGMARDLRYRGKTWRVRITVSVAKSRDPGESLDGVPNLVDSDPVSLRS